MKSIKAFYSKSYSLLLKGGSDTDFVWADSMSVFLGKPLKSIQTHTVFRADT